MDKQFCKSMLLLVNTPTYMDLLHEYVSVRIAGFHQQLENTKDPHRVLEIQGAIAELRRFKTLRDEMIKGAE